MDDDAILKESYTVADLVSELKKAAANGYNISNMMDFIKSQITANIKNMDEDVTKETAESTGVFALIRLGRNLMPIGYEGKTRMAGLIEILCSGSFSDDELKTLRGPVDDE
jgi:hypothetical protein